MTWQVCRMPGWSPGPGCGPLDTRRSSPLSCRRSNTESWTGLSWRVGWHWMNLLSLKNFQTAQCLPVNKWMRSVLCPIQLVHWISGKIRKNQNSGKKQPLSNKYQNSPQELHLFSIIVKVPYSISRVIADTFQQVLHKICSFEKDCINIFKYPNKKIF